MKTLNFRLQLFTFNFKLLTTRRLLAITLLLLFTFYPVIAAAPSLLRPGMQAFWSLGEASGTRYDSVTQGVGPAAQFTAANSESLSIANNVSVTAGDIDFSVAAWVYPDTNPAIANIVSHRDTGAGDYFLREENNKVLFGIIKYSGGFGQDNVISTVTLSTGQWSFVVGWRDKTANKLYIQINNGTADEIGQTFTPTGEASTFRIGADENTDRYWNGRIQGVGFWKKVLTSAERTELYNSGRGYAYRDLTGSLLTSLNAYWNLNEGSGTRYDSAGSNNLTDNNTVTQATGLRGDNSLGDNATVTQAAGPYRSAIAGQFTSANSEYISIPDNAALSTGDIDYTWEAWVYLDSKGTSQYVLSKNASASEHEYEIHYQLSGDRFHYIMRNAANNTDIDVTANNFGSPSTATWYFIVAWHNSIDDTINIQVNNGTANSTAIAGGGRDSASALQIGHDQESGVNGYWDGRISKVGFWKKVLSAQERTDLYNAGNGNLYDGTNFLVDTGSTLKTSLQAWWELDELCCTRFDKISPGVGPAAQFTAANSEYLSIADNAALSTGNIDFTVGAWVYMDTLPAEAYIVSKFTTTPGQRAYALYYTGGSTGKFRFIVSNDGSATNNAIANTFGTPSTGTWYFVVGWHDAVAKTINIAINNGAVDSVAHTTGVLDDTSPFILGVDNSGSSFWNGRIQNVGFWKRVLTSSEITSLYNSGSGLRRKDLSEQMERSLISYWDLNEGSGTRYDGVGGNNLADNATVTQATGVAGGNSLGDNATVTHNRGLSYFDTAAVGNSAQFTSASSKYLSIADNAALSTGNIDFTFGGWVYLDTKVANQYFVSKWAGGTNREYALLYELATDRFRADVSGDGTAVTTVLSNNLGSPAVATWYFVVVQHDAAAKTVSIQVNNRTANSVVHTTGVFDGTAPFNIGAQNGDQWTNGRIARAFFTKRVLSQAERTALYNQGIGQSYQNLQRPYRGKSF